MFLPSAPVEAVATNPRILLVISKPKIGKTPIAALVPNSLLINLEGRRADFVTAMKMDANSVSDIAQIGSLIIKAGRPYQTLIVDTTSALEEMCIPYGETLYANTGQGKNWFARGTDGKILIGADGLQVPGEGRLKYGGLLNMPDGQGYGWLREAFFKIIAYLETLAPQLILMGHIKDIMLDKNSSNVSSIEVDLFGKTKGILARKCDAMGYMYRKGNQNIISFKSNDEQACGTTSHHLSGKEIVISQMDKTTGKITAFWDRIYLPVGAAAPLDASEEPELLEDATAAPEETTPLAVAA